MKYKNKSIFYVNYSPYENSGHILQFLISNFKYVFLFSIGFHDLGTKRGSNTLVVYKNGIEISRKPYFHMNIGKNMEYLFVPFRSLVNLFQIFSIGNGLHKRYGKVDIFFSANAFTAWAGLILKNFKFVESTVFWVWDYYPLKSQNYLILTMRWLYWQFDRVAMFSDKVIFLNSKLASLHGKSKIFGKSFKYSIVPIGTENKRSNAVRVESGEVSIAFLGVLKKSQGLDFIFDSEDVLTRNFQNIKIEIIGGGPDLEYFLDRSNKSKLNIKFHGMLEDSGVDKILFKSTIGLATYMPDKSNVSYFGDPSKVKKYLSFGLPVITTDVFEFSKEIEKNNAGFVIKYGDEKSLVKSIRKIISKYRYYSNKSYELSKKYSYKHIYSNIFNI